MKVTDDDGTVLLDVTANDKSATSWFTDAYLSLPPEGKIKLKGMLYEAAESVYPHGRVHRTGMSENE